MGIQVVYDATSSPEEFLDSFDNVGDALKFLWEKVEKEYDPFDTKAMTFDVQRFGPTRWGIRVQSSIADRLFTIDTYTPDRFASLVLKLGTFDTAIPQEFSDRFQHITGVYPYGYFVWNYPEGSVWGEPVPLHQKARELLAQFRETVR